MNFPRAPIWESSLPPSVSHCTKFHRCRDENSIVPGTVKTNWKGNGTQGMVILLKAEPAPCPFRTMSNLAERMGRTSLSKETLFASLPLLVPTNFFYKLFYISKATTRFPVATRSTGDEIEKQNDGQISHFCATEMLSPCYAVLKERGSLHSNETSVSFSDL